MFKNSLIKMSYKVNKLVLDFLFPLTSNGKLIKSLKNIHQGKRCFIIGNGPSLKVEDLNNLKNEITFAFNRIYYIFDKTKWRPTYYFAEDDKTVLNSKEEMKNLQLRNKFFPVNFPRDYKINFKNASYYILKLGRKNEELKFSKNIVNGIYWGNTVAYTAIQVAVYMGFKEIYLIGIDHNFKKIINDAGVITIDETAEDYFSQEYNLDKEKLYIPNIDMSTRAFNTAKTFATKNNIKIFNATRGGKLEVFERKNFDDINFEKERESNENNRSYSSKRRIYKVLQ